MSTPRGSWRSRVSPFIADPFFRHFFGDGADLGRPDQRVQRSLGSGVIIDRSGIIVTNHHVIANADEIKVALSDRREFDCDVMLSDERTDLAVLKIKGDPAATFPTSNSAIPTSSQVGDLVLAIGDPVRRRPDRDQRHRLGAGADAGRRLRLSVLHPDRRGDQSGQFRRAR